MTPEDLIKAALFELTGIAEEIDNMAGLSDEEKLDVAKLLNRVSALLAGEPRALREAGLAA